MFKILIKDTRGGICPDGGVAPLEAALDRADVSAEIRLHLQALPSGSGGNKRKLGTEDGDDKTHHDKHKQSQSKETERLRRTVENLA